MSTSSGNRSVHRVLNRQWRTICIAINVHTLITIGLGKERGSGEGSGWSVQTDGRGVRTFGEGHITGLIGSSTDGGCGFTTEGDDSKGARGGGKAKEGGTTCQTGCGTGR